MDLRAGDGRSPCLSLAVRPLHRHRQLVLGHFAQGFGQFTGRPAGCVRLLGVGVVDDLPGRQVLRRQ